MITGYNTDIEFNGVVYHVQTEDKGPSMPMILSLVYDRGTILASKRAAYDLDQEDFSEEILAERLQRQHKLICAAVLAGRIEDLKRMSAAARQHKRVESERAPDVTALLADADLRPGEEKVLNIAVTPKQEFASDLNAFETLENVPPIPMPNKLSMPAIATLDETELTVLDDVKILEDYSFLSPEDLKIVSDLAGQARPEHDKLSVEIVGSPEFRGGKKIPVFILVCRGSRREVIRGTEIMVKILGSSFKPVIYHSVTDKNGLAQLEVEVPSFSSGRATVLARAKEGSEEVEVRRPVVHG